MKESKHISFTVQVVSLNFQEEKIYLCISCYGYVIFHDAKKNAHALFFNIHACYSHNKSLNCFNKKSFYKKFVYHKMLKNFLPF